MSAATLRRPFPDGCEIHELDEIYYFELLFACVLKSNVELTLNVLLHAARHADAARFGKTFQTRCDIDAIAEDIIAIENNIANIDADTKLNSLLILRSGIPFCHSLLNFDGTAQRIYNTAKFCQQTVTSAFHYPTAIFLDFWIKKLATMGFQANKCAFLVVAH
jgi:hypothetical protein